MQEVKLSGVKGHDSREANSKADDVNAGVWRGLSKTQCLRRQFPVTVTFVLAISTHQAHRPDYAQTDCRAAPISVCSTDHVRGSVNS